MNYLLHNVLRQAVPAEIPGDCWDYHM
jgi:hypothetical protein